MTIPYGVAYDFDDLDMLGRLNSNTCRSLWNAALVCDTINFHEQLRKVQLKNILFSGTSIT